MAKPKGTLTVGIALLPPLVQVPKKDAAGSCGGYGGFFNIYEGLVRAKWAKLPEMQSMTDYLPEIAESWEIAPDYSKITFHIRKGIPWHRLYGDFGEVTAEDVAWSFNNALEAGATSNCGEQITPAHRLGWEVAGPYTVVMKVDPLGFDPTWPHWHGYMSSTYTCTIVSKKAYDQLGEGKFITTPIGTGPFEAEKWAGHDEVVAEAVENHWRITPGIQTLHVVEMPERSTREAAFRAGEIDITELPAKIAGPVVKATGAENFELGLASPDTIYFSGNYWGATCPTCEDPDVYRKWPGFLDGIKKGYPWIGDPEDADSMEKARKVRWALSMGIDREAIVEAVLGGISRPAYVNYSVYPGDPAWQEEWFVPYDPVKAKQWLTEAGVPEGYNIPLWSPGNLWFWDPEVGDAVGEMWGSNLGLNVSIDHADYAVRRPETVDHTMNIPWLHGMAGTPDASRANMYCPQPGHLAGVTLPDDICEIGFRNDTELDPQKRIENNILFQNYMSYWQLQAATATVGNFFLYKPYVKGWKPYQTGYFSNPESIRLEK